MSQDRGEELLAKYILLAAQNNDIESLKRYLTVDRSLLNERDEFGWSLLMIACQSNAMEVFKYLITQDVDIFIQDKAGNSAYSLAKRTHNIEIMRLLKRKKHKLKETLKKNEDRATTDLQHMFYCSYCENEYEDKNSHLRSTLHNINVSKSSTKHAWYGIPESNKGFQMLLRSGWDREKGLGRASTGTIYPVKAKLKPNRFGLGIKNDGTQNKIVKLNKRNSLKEEKRIQDKHRKLERDFRRQFH